MMPELFWAEIQMLKQQKRLQGRLPKENADSCAVDLHVALVQRDLEKQRFSQPRQVSTNNVFFGVYCRQKSTFGSYLLVCAVFINYSVWIYCIVYLYLQGEHVYKALLWRSACCDDSCLILFSLLLICSQMQTNHIQKAKEGGVIHKKPPRRGPEEVTKSHFYLPSMLTVGTFPYIASLITQKQSRKDRLA